MADENVISAAPAATSANVAAQAVPSGETSAPATVTPAQQIVKTETAAESTVLGQPEIAPTKVADKADLGKTETAEVKTEIKVEAKPEVKTETKTETDTKDAKPPVEADKKTTDGADKKLPEEPKKEEASQSDEPAPLPSFEPWKFPEGVTVDEARIGEFNKDLGEFVREAKADPKLAQILGQKFIDRHISEVKEVASKVAEAYDAVWKKQTADWYDAFVKDPELGGNRQETTTAAARESIRKHGGTPEQQDELRTILKKTGLGNHPALIRYFANVNRDLSEGTVVPGISAPSVEPPKSLKQKMYGNKVKK